MLTKLSPNDKRKLKKFSPQTHSKVTNCQNISLNKTQKTVTNFKSQSVMLNLM